MNEDAEKTQYFGPKILRTEVAIVQSEVIKVTYSINVIQHGGLEIYRNIWVFQTIKLSSTDSLALDVREYPLEFYR